MISRFITKYEREPEPTTNESNRHHAQKHHYRSTFAAFEFALFKTFFGGSGGTESKVSV